VWVGEISFWYRPTRVVPDQRPLNGRCCCCCCSSCKFWFHYDMSVLWWNVSRTLLIWCTMISHHLVVSQCITATQRVSWQPKLLPFCVEKLLLFWKPSLVVVYSKSALDWRDRNLLEWPGITNVQERHCVCFVYFVTCSSRARSQTWWLRNAVLVKLFINFLFVLISKYLQYFNAVGWASGRAFSL